MTLPVLHLRGDVVLLDYPYAHGNGSKVRPVFIVQNDRDNQRLTNTIVALITKNVSRVQGTKAGTR